VAEILPDQIISGKAFKESLVYIWKSRGAVLYVGMSKVGLKRVFGPHDILSDVKEADIIEIYRTPNPLELERYFIKLYKPLYNSSYKYKSSKQKINELIKSVAEEVKEEIKEEI